MNKKVNRFYMLLHRLRENYPQYDCTFSQCCNPGCTKHARGGGTCPDCLEVEIGVLLKDASLAETLHKSVKEHRQLLSDAVMVLEGHASQKNSC